MRAYLDFRGQKRGFHWTTEPKVAGSTPASCIRNDKGLWKGFGVQPAPGDWSLLRPHVDEVLLPARSEKAGQAFYSSVSRMTTITKICNRCEDEKPLKDFYKHREQTDGLRGEYKECYKAKNRARQPAKTSTRKPAHLDLNVPAVFSGDVFQDMERTSIAFAEEYKQRFGDDGLTGQERRELEDWLSGIGQDAAFERYIASDKARS